MQLKAHFTKGKKSTSLFKWKTQDCEIRDSGGKVIFFMPKVKAPSQWSPLAVEIAAAKYFRKTGAGQRGFENSVEQMVDRVVNSIKKSGLRQKYFKNKSQAETFANELKFILLDQRACFNSPVWFNCGLHEAYGIKSSVTQWAWDEKSKSAKNVEEAYARPQVSACFIQGVEDNLESIFELAKTEARLFKFGSGSGTNFSKLRSKYDHLEGGGFSSGLISFLEVLDRGAGSVKSGGTTRRAAKMVCLDIDHPEIIEFIHWKSSEERKAKKLAELGYGQGLDSESYHTVSGQNSNNSIRLTNKFMQSVIDGGDWDLRSPLTGKLLRKLKSQELWEGIAESAWQCADPGLQFNDAIQAWHTCKKSGPIRASNPCSEFMFLDDTACNLASLNLLKFLSPQGQFDLEGYLHCSEIVFLAQDILVDLAGYPTKAIAENSHDFRPLGLGFAGLGAFLMQMGIAYGSEAGRSWASHLASLLTAKAYLVSVGIAKIKNPYSKYRVNRSSHLAVIRQHQKFSKNLKLEASLPAIIGQTVQDLWSEVVASSKKYGIRNSQTTVMAPTGTIGLVMDTDTTGIEPEFSLIKNKKLSGGGDLQMVSRSLQHGLEKLGYSEAEILEIKTQLEVRGQLPRTLIKAQHQAVFNTAMEISPMGHLQMMAALQAFVSGAISKTVNIAETSKVKDVKEIYLQAWRLGLKSIAIYRDKSKMDQPLNAPNPNGTTIKCSECGAPTEFAGGCFRCVNCGTVMGCA